MWIMENVGGTDARDGGSKVGYSTIGCYKDIEEGMSVVVYHGDSSQCISRL